MTSKNYEIEEYKVPLPILCQNDSFKIRTSSIEGKSKNDKMEDKSNIDLNHVSIDALETQQEEYPKKNRWKSFFHLPTIQLVEFTWSVGKGEPQDRLWSTDIVRLVAAISLLTSSVIVHTSSDWQFANSLLYPIRSQWGFNIFLVLIGRAFVSGWVVPQNSKADQDKKDSGLSQSAVYKMGQSLLLRPFRFFLPVIVVQLLQRKACQSGPAFSNGFSYLFDQGYRDQWCTPNSANSLITRIISLFTENNSSVLIHQTGMLYQSPLLFQASFYALGIASFTAIFRTSSRTFLFIFLALMNWTTYTFLFPVMLGLLLADLQESKVAIRLFKDSSSPKRFDSKKSFLVIVLNAALLALLLFIPVIRDNLSDGFDKLQTLYGFANKSETTQGYHWLRFSDCLSAAMLVLLAESLQPAKVGVCTKSLAILGRHLSAGLVVLHPIVIYGILPHLFRSSFVDINGHNTALILKLWASTLFISMALAIPFNIFVEMGSLLIGKAFVASFLPNSF